MNWENKYALSTALNAVATACWAIALTTDVTAGNRITAIVDGFLLCLFAFFAVRSAELYDIEQIRYKDKDKDKEN